MTTATATTAETIAQSILFLRGEFDKLDRINPNGELAGYMRAAMDKIDNADALRIIYRANIKFVSLLALTRLILRGENVD